MLKRPGGGASGVDVNIGDEIRCKVTNAGGTQASVGTSWFILESNRGQSTESVLGVAKLSTQAIIEDNTTVNDTDIVTPKKWHHGFIKMLTRALTFAGVTFTKSVNITGNVIINGSGLRSDLTPTGWDDCSVLFTELDGESTIGGLPPSIGKEVTVVNISPYDLYFLNNDTASTSTWRFKIPAINGQTKAKIPAHGMAKIFYDTALSVYRVSQGTPEITDTPKKYYARINQSGTSAPTVGTLVFNTFGLTPTFNYVAVGEYELEVSSAILTQYKVPLADNAGMCIEWKALYDNVGAGFGWYMISWVSTTKISIKTVDGTFTAADGILTDFPLVIEIYP